MTSSKMRINLAKAQELLELLGLGPAQVATIARFPADHEPIEDIGRLATILSFPLTDALRERADFSLVDDTAPEAPGA